MKFVSRVTLFPIILKDRPLIYFINPQNSQSRFIDYGVKNLFQALHSSTKQQREVTA